MSTLPEGNDANSKVISMNPNVTSTNPKVPPIATVTIAVGAKMMRKATNTVKYS